MKEIKKLFEDRLENYRTGFHELTPWHEYKKNFTSAAQRGWSYSEKLVFLIIKLRRVRDYGDK